MKLESKYKLYLNKSQKIRLLNFFHIINITYKNLIKNKKIPESIYLDKYILKCLKTDVYKSKYNVNSKYIREKNTCILPKTSIKLYENKIYIKDIGYIKIKPRINFKYYYICRIVKSKTNEYFVSFVIEKNNIYLPKTNKAIGIDMGIESFCAFSNGAKIKNPKYYNKFEFKIKHLQKIRSKKVYMSNNYKKISLKINKVYKEIKNKEYNFIHKLSKNIIVNYDIICIENLDINSLKTYSKIKKSINYVCWRKFIEMLKYKSKLYNKTVVEIDKYYPSTKVCSYCGYKNSVNSLSIREYICEKCNNVLDRDINAARNILFLGIKKINKKIRN